MRVTIGVLADFASVSEGKKLNILGIFSFIMSTIAPVSLPQIKMVVQFEFDQSEAGSKRSKTELIDPDGNEIISIEQTMVVAQSADGRPTLVNQILSLNNIEFPRFGDYEFRISIDDNIPPTIVPLSVINIPPKLESN